MERLPSLSTGNISDWHPAVVSTEQHRWGLSLAGLCRSVFHPQGGGQPSDQGKEEEKGEEEKKEEEDHHDHSDGCIYPPGAGILRARCDSYCGGWGAGVLQAGSRARGAWCSRWTWCAMAGGAYCTTMGDSRGRRGRRPPDPSSDPETRWSSR